MRGSQNGTRWRGKTYEVPVPPTRAPFVNTPLLSLGRLGRGPERFWIASFARDGGCFGVVVYETGDYRVLQFDESHKGFYGAVRGGRDTLWLCGDLSSVVRLDLRTMKYESHATGARAALLFQGMAFDPPTGRLFAAAFPGPDTAAFSFDTRGRKTARLYDRLTPLHYMRFSFPNGDGTWSILMHTPGVGLLSWDPRCESVETVFESLGTPAELTYRLISDGDGRWYFPQLGWYDPHSRQFQKGRPAPEQEMGWFAVRGGKAYGAVSDQERLRVGCWDLATGKVRNLLTAECQSLGVNLTESGKIVAVDLAGSFFCWDADTGAGADRRPAYGHGQPHGPRLPHRAATTPGNAVHLAAVLGGGSPKRTGSGLRAGSARVRRGPGNLVPAWQGVYGGVHGR